MASSLEHRSGALALNDICYRQIKGYAIFGEFQLVVDKSTGCFNATKLCNIGGKLFRHWKALDRTKKIIEYFENRRRPKLEAGLYEITGDNKDSIQKQITGQYVQKKLILDIASWISVEFYDKCNNVIINYFVNQHQNMTTNERQSEIDELEQRMKRLLMENENKDNIIQDKNDRIDELIEITKRMEIKFGIRFDQEQQNNELIDKVDYQNSKLDKIQTKLNIAVEDRAPQPKQSNKRERFILLKRNDSDYPYHHIN
ncbi:MAG: KilA-N domain-containing protein [Cetobacterium sp.]